MVLNLKCNTFYRIGDTRVLSSSSFRVLDKVNVKKNDKKFDLRTKLELFFENKVFLLRISHKRVCGKSLTN